MGAWAVCSSSCICCEALSSAEPLLVVSPWFEKRREQYQDALLELSCSGDWDGWIAFFAEGAAASAAESQHKVERLVALQAEHRDRVHQAGKRGVAERLAADLVGIPDVNRTGVMRRYGLTGQGAANAIRSLVELGLLEPTPFRTAHRAQMYRAQAVLTSCPLRTARRRAASVLAPHDWADERERFRGRARWHVRAAGGSMIAMLRSYSSTSSASGTRSVRTLRSSVRNDGLSWAFSAPWTYLSPDPASKPTAGLLNAALLPRYEGELDTHRSRASPGVTATLDM